MKHEFIILLNGELKTYHNFEDIPDKFDNLISFAPHIDEGSDEGSHTHEEHEEINSWTEKMKDLMRRETNGNN